MMILTGLDRLMAGESKRWRGARAGLICHPASVTRQLDHAAVALARLDTLSVRALFGPQHGVRAEKQDDMIESDSFVDPRTGLPVHSLYGEVRKPTPEMLDGLDVVFCDLQDVGVRVYTYAWTMTLAMEACRDAGVPFVVLDRPNPVGGLVREGAILEPGYESFVGRFPVPLRHGLTIGEMARLCNGSFGIGCDLDVVPCSGWNRSLWFDDGDLPFVLPSPNLPTLDSCIVYPGMVLLEGTNLSEGRGTTRPFELFGAPFLDPDRLVHELSRFELAGVRFRPCYFEPTFQKHAGVLCGGAQMHVTDRDGFRPVTAALAILCVARSVSDGAFEWRSPPYEYETVRRPIDIIWGSDSLRTAIDRGAEPADILTQLSPALEAFERSVGSVLMY